jgi:hypothetical protein
MFLEYANRLQKLHANHGFLPPHNAARVARLIDIGDEFKSLWDRAVNLYLSPFFRHIANDTLNRSAGGPNNGRASRPKNFGAC